MVNDSGARCAERKLVAIFMPNTFAYLVFFSWPLVAVLMFATQPPARALAGAVIVGYLLLPERVAVDFPMIPAIDKVLMISLTAAAVTALALRRQRQITGPEHRTAGRAGGVAFQRADRADACHAVPDGAHQWGAGHRRAFLHSGIKLYDAVSLMMSAAIAIVPFVLGMRVLGSPEAQTDLLRVLVLAACAYACLALFEVR